MWVIKKNGSREEFDDKKIIALTGAVINAINNIKKPSKKLTKLYNKLIPLIVKG